MTEVEIRAVVDRQRAAFAAGATLDVDTRRMYLKKLRRAITAREDRIMQALALDLGKSTTEAYMCEVGMAQSELTYQLRHLRAFTRPHRVRTPLAQFAAKSFTYPSPYGVVLIMSPWNYPFLLSVEPLIEAIAAGNTVVLKPSAYSPNSTEVLVDLLAEVFPPEVVCVVTGGREENRAMLDTRFDYVFFTGSKTVGQMVYRKATEHMTPVTLELGGKSPCIVDGSAKVALAARRIVFGKFLNCGQTCVAPDYILCHSSVKEELLAAIKREIVRQFGEDPLDNRDYGKIISRKHYERVAALIDRDKVVHGGRCDAGTLRIQPTVMDGVTWDDAVMGEEIFGPVLPVLTFEDTEEVIRVVNGHDRPLALYLFTTDKGQEKEILSRCAFGGGCVNDVIIHLATCAMPFGGFGASGMGAYHGKKGFETFTHYKSIVDKKNFVDLNMRYQPYGKKNERMIRRFLK